MTTLAVTGIRRLVKPLKIAYFHGRTVNLPLPEGKKKEEYDMIDMIISWNMLFCMYIYIMFVI